MPKHVEPVTACAGKIGGKIEVVEADIRGSASRIIVTQGGFGEAPCGVRVAEPTFQIGKSRKDCP